jgi:hypothetical protein
MAWMRELSPSAPALVIRWSKKASRPARWRLSVRPTWMIGFSRECVAQKCQLFQCFSAQPRRWYSQKYRRFSLMAQAGWS